MSQRGGMDRVVFRTIWRDGGDSHPIVTDPNRAFLPWDTVQLTIAVDIEIFFI
jgi:hypothetical protein